MSRPTRGYLVWVKPGVELRITTTGFVESFTRDRVRDMGMTGTGVRIRTPDATHEFFLTPALASEALRLLDPKHEPAVHPMPEKRRRPTPRRHSPEQLAAGRAALELWSNGLPINRACESSGIGRGSFESMRHKRHGALRAAYERAAVARRALHDVRSLAGRHAE